MSLIETFHTITADDVVTVEYEGGSFTEPVMAIDGQEESRVVSFDIPQVQPRLVRRFDRVWVERRAKGHPREWTTHEPVHDIRIDD